MKNYCQNIFIVGLFFVLLSAFAPSSFAQTKKEKTMTIVGKFKSKQGVMTPLSCYCYEGGEIITDTKEAINICLKDVKNAENAQNCTKISITGYYITQENNPEPTSPCAKGAMRYFKVISYKCL